MRYPLTLTVNGQLFELEIGVERTLLRVLRSDLGLTGTKEGCDDSECGACMVLVDGAPVNSCCFLALQADCREVTTVEGLISDSGLDVLQRWFLKAGAVQCGFCTPGMLMSATAFLQANAQPDEAAVREALAGNLCRCTGYGKILEAVLRAAEQRQDAAPLRPDPA